MTIETASNIYDLNSSLPADGDEQAEGDDHIRMIKAALKASLPGLQGALHRAIAKSTGFTPALTENGCVYDCTGGITATFLAIAGVPDGTHYWINAYSGTVTLDPNGAELINGAATVVLPSGSWAFVFKLGTAWHAMLGSGDLSTQVPATVHAATSKATPVDADELPLVDSAASYGLKRLTWANLKTALSSFFMALVAPGASGNILTSNGSAWASAAPPASGVTSVNGNTGAISAAQIAAAATAGYGYTPANAANAGTDHTHSGYVSTNMTHGAVGSLCLCSSHYYQSAAAGGTNAGSSLRPAGWVHDGENSANPSSGYEVTGSALSGTWRCLGVSGGNSNMERCITLWQRIS